MGTVQNEESQSTLASEVTPIDSANNIQPNGKRQTVYADYQATTPVDPRVLERMTPYWRELFGNPHSSDHIVGWRSAEAVQGAASSVAALIGADPDEIIFTSGATEANNLALLGLARRAPPNAGASWSAPLSTNASWLRRGLLKSGKASPWRPSRWTARASST